VDSPPLLHLITPAEWRAALAAGVVAPPSLAEVGFVHLSAAGQVALPADRLFHGRTDLVLLALDPDRIGVPVRHEPGVPTDPASMLFPHAYGPVPTAAVLAVLPYRPRPDGGFTAPVVPTLDPAGRHSVLGPSVLRRAATSEEPVAGGVAVLTAPVPTSRRHNQLLIDSPVSPEQLAADTDRVLGGAGVGHRQARLVGGRLADTAAALAAGGWDVAELVGMAAPAGGEPDPRVTQVGLDAVAQLADHYAIEDTVADVRCLAVREGGTVIRCALLTIDGGTALLDTVLTEPAGRSGDPGDALVRTALALAAEAGCDLVVVDAAADDHRYRHHGFSEVTRAWSVRR
jgi:uncharacterized protein (DUF952 family)